MNERLFRDELEKRCRHRNEHHCNYDDDECDVDDCPLLWNILKKKY